MFNSASVIRTPCPARSFIQRSKASLSKVSSFGPVFVMALTLEVLVISPHLRSALSLFPRFDFLNQAVEGGDAQDHHEEPPDGAVANLKSRVNHQRVLRLGFARGER